MAMRSTGDGAGGAPGRGGRSGVVRPIYAGGAPRRGGRSGLVRPIYEDFTRTSEWQQVDESHILSVHLPGFMKEQINVSTVGRNTIRVQGERHVAGNRWSRFQEDFQIPENGVLDSIHEKYEGGILTITVPKVRAALPQKAQAIDDIQKEPRPQEDKGEVVAEASTGLGTEPQEPSRDIGDQKQVPTPQTAVDKEGMETIDRKELPGSELVKDGVDKELHQKVVKGLTGLNEERQLLVNMGVAMLVIVALISYITYSFASAKDKN